LIDDGFSVVTAFYAEDDHGGESSAILTPAFDLA
jgi:hypothetical protein